MNASLPPSSSSQPGAGDILLSALAYIKAEAAASAPQLPAEFLELAGQLPVVRPLAPGLVVTYLYDEGEVYSYVQRHHVQALNTSAEALHELAVINLGRHADGALKIFHHEAVHGLMLDGQFEASLLLVDEIWDGPAKAFTPNGVVAAVPSRGVLLFCDRASAQGIAELRQHLAKGQAADAIEISAALFERDERGDWHPFETA